MTNKYTVFHIDGGLGKHVAATAVAKALKQTHKDRDLIIVCAYPEVFLNLKYVDRVYKIGNTPYFYEDYILNKDSILFKHEPYFTTEHVHKKEPLIKNWIELYGLDYEGQQPELVFNVRQKQLAANKWRREKPIMLIQTNGGMLNGQQPYAWTRDMPYNVALDIATKYAEEYHIIQIARPGATAIPNVEVLSEQMSNMELFSLITVSAKRLFIDSCMQHAAAALNAKSTVLWIGTSPKLFGYDTHDNISALPSDGVKLIDSYLFDYSFDGSINECPYIDSIAFDMQSIVDSIDAQ